MSYVIQLMFESFLLTKYSVVVIILKQSCYTTP